MKNVVIMEAPRPLNPEPVLTSEMEFTALRLTFWLTPFVGTDSILR